LLASVQSHTNERQHKTNYKKDEEQQVVFLDFACNHLSFTHLISSFTSA